MKITTLKSIIASLAMLAFSSAHADSFVIAGRSGPWMYVNGGLNSGFQYGVGDHIAPTIISAIGGVNVGVGQSITLSYQSGTVGTGGSHPGPFDASGDPTIPNPQPPNINGPFPNYYMSSVPTVNALSLVGTFANSAGQIVGAPFGVGNGPLTLSVPSGATRLQLGVNDNLYGDNSGSWTINATITAVPEPGLAAFMGLAGLLWIRSRYWTDSAS